MRLARALRRAPGGLVAMVALVLPIEWYVRGHEIDVTTMTEWIWRLEGKAASGPEANVDVLLLGDSYIRGGLSPLIIQQRLGRSVRTIAPSGCSPAADYYILRRILERGIRPRAVVVEFMPRLLEVEPDFRARGWADLLTTREALDLARTCSDPDTFAAIALSKLLPSIHQRHDLRAYVCERLRATWWNKRFPLMLVTWHAKRNQGAEVLGNVDSISSPEPGVPLHRIVYPLPWRCVAINELYLHKFLALAQAHAIPVYWLVPAVLPEVQQAAERAGDDAEFGRFVASTANAHPNVVVLDGRYAEYQTSAFHDAVHLSARGNACLSVDVSDCLAAHLGGREPKPRWMMLPRYRPAPEEAMLEDYERCVEVRTPKAVAAQNKSVETRSR